MKKIVVGGLTALLAIALLSVGSHYASAAPPPNAAAVEGLTPGGVVSTRPPVVVGGRSTGNINRPFAADAQGDIIASLDPRAVATYRYSASFTPQPTGAVTLFTIQGSATKTVRVKRILLSGHSTANAQETIAVQRTSALGAGGTVVSPTAFKNDTNSPNPTAVVSHYTSTLKAAGTPVGGPAVTADFWTGVVTTPTVYTPQIPIFPEDGVPIGQAIVLRGASDFLEVQSINAGNLSAGTVLQYTVETEETTAALE